MKIIQEGTIPTPEPIWWHGRKVHCNHCRTIFELEPGDKIREGGDRTPNGQRWAVFNCPKCNTEITIHKKP